MSLQPKEKDWIDKLAVQANVSAAIAKRREQKDAILQRMATQMESRRDEILQKIKQLKAGDGQEAMKLLDYVSRDQTQEFDLADQANGMVLSDEAQKTLTEIGVLMDNLSRDLDAKVKTINPQTGAEEDPEVPLFSKGDLKKELYQPVVRQGMMSDTFVADEYSDTAEMLKGSMDLYKDRLEEEGVKGSLRENVNLGMVLMKSAVTMVGSGLDMDGLKGEGARDPATWTPSLEFIEDLTGDEAGKKAGAISEVVSTGLEVISMGMEGYDAIKEGSEGKTEQVLSEEGQVEGNKPVEKKKAEARRAAASPKLAAQLTAAVAQALGSKLRGNNWDLGVAASSAYGLAVKPAPLALQLATSPLALAQVEQVRNLLKAGFTAALKACDPETDATNDVPKSDAVIAEAAQKMVDKFQTALDANALLPLLKEEKFGEVLQAVSTAADAAVTEGLTPNLGKLMEDPGRAKAAKDAVGRKLTEDFQREIDEGEKRDKEQLDALMNSKEDEKKAGLLEQRIREMQKSESIVKWAASIAGLGLDVASKFIAPLAVAGAALSLAQSVTQAAKRTREFLDFCDAEAGMFRAASVFSPAVANFTTNAQKQSLHFAINAALDLVNMIGAVCECVGAPAFGLGVVVGKAMQAGASGIGALEAAVYELAKRYDLEKAWADTRAAMENPENRRLGLIAIKQNPTLAKYSVAWGAIVKKDVLVGDFLGSCGLTAEELTDPKSKTSEVVKYLELRMPEDNTVVGREVPQDGWAPAEGDIALTPASWIGAKSLGEKVGKVAVQDTREVELALKGYAANGPGLQQGAAKTDLEKARDQLQEAQQALGRYQFKREGNKGEVAEMRKVVAIFRNKMGSRIVELENLIRTA